jgi:hypothetical protein
MDTQILPDGFEPSYWNVVFHPSERRLARLLLGRFQHVSAFAYVPGFRVWVIYDCQWGGTRISFVSHGTLLIPFIRNCSIVKVDRVYKPMVLASRFVFFGFYCVPAIKQLLGLSCVAATPDGLYRHLINNGGSLFNERVEPSTAAARSNAPTGAGAGAN